MFVDNFPKPIKTHSSPTFEIPSGLDKNANKIINNNQICANEIKYQTNDKINI